MAPNLAVRSDSWLNLSVDQLDKRRSLNARNSNYYDRSSQQRQPKPPERTTSVTGVNYYNSSGSEDRKNNGNNNNLNERLSASRSSLQYSRASGNKNEHLLIRLRQQSYQLNRSNSTLASSNLSNSIELEPTILNSSGKNNDNNHHGHHRQFEFSNRRLPSRSLSTNFSAIDPIKEQQVELDVAQAPKDKDSSQSTRLMRENSRLSRLRNRLERKSTRRKRDNNQQSSSPLARSWSSLSEQLSDKLSDFRHSWKHFLYQYSQMSSQERSRAGQPKVRVNCFSSAQTDDGNDTDDMFPLSSSFEQSVDLAAMSGQQQLADSITPTSQLVDDRIKHQHENHQQQKQMIDKSQLTSEWLSRHYSRPHNGDSDQNNNHNPPRKLNKGAKGDRPRSLQIVQTSRGRSDIESQDIGRQDDHLDDQIPRIRSDVNLTSTKNKLTSRQANTKGNSSDSTSSSTTLVSANREQISECLSLESLLGEIELATSGIESRSRTKLAKSASNKLTVNNTQQNWPVKTLTSDYWSTAASSEKYKQQVAKSGANLNSANQMPAQMAHPNALLNLMGADQEYYLEVAAASQQQAPLAVINQIGAPMDINQVTLMPHQHHQQQQQQLQQQQQQQMASAGLMLPPDEDYDDYAVPTDESCRLDRTQVELVQLIGEGQKGYVFLGKLQSKDGSVISDVAIKTLKYETGQLIEKLMREAAMMRQLEHPHIIKFIGVCPETPALIAMELAQFGEIKQYFKLHRHLITVPQLVLFTFQISTALSYLESKQYVHRDVAARNVLVCSHNCVKLADFGLSRNLQPQPQQHPALDPNLICDEDSLMQAPIQNQQPQSDTSLYIAAPKVKLPVRWLAPESLVFRRFTSASDVWMFAVCGWELFHLCQARPWASIRNNQVLAAIESGQRLPRPPNCPSRLYQLMLQCWSYAPIQRPKFREIKQSIWSIYLNERAKQQLELEQQQQAQQQQMQQANQRQPVIPNGGGHQLIQPERLVLLNTTTSQPSISPLSQPFQHQVVPSPMLLNVASSNNQLQTQRLSGATTSGYSSSATPTATMQSGNNLMDSSANSSRSSSMGSLARTKQYQRQQLALAQQQQLARQQQVVLANQEPKRVSPISQQAQLNARRFFKQPHVLQKQRSQGSIGLTAFNNSEAEDFRLSPFEVKVPTPEPKSAASKQLTTKQPTTIYLDDDWRRNRHTKRAPKVIYDEDEDGDDEANSNSDEPRDIRSQSVAARRQPLQPNVDLVGDLNQEFGAKLRLPSAEPSYEGLHVAVNRFWRPASWRNPNPNSDGSKTPTNLDKETRDKQRKSSSSSSKGSAKNADPTSKSDEGRHLLQSLGITPMKAKLRQSMSTSPTGGATTAGKTQQRQVAAGLADSSLVERVDEQQRQLALHQRLLGRIRPASMAQGSKSPSRRSVNMSPSEQQADLASQSSATPTTVDQSLRLLESLISDEERQRQQLNRSSSSPAANVKLANKSTASYRPTMILNWQSRR